MKKLFGKILLLISIIFLTHCKSPEQIESLVMHDKDKGLVSIRSKDQHIAMRLKYKDGCYFNRVDVRGQQVIFPQKGVSSAIKVDGQWYSTRDKSSMPRVTVKGNSVSIERIIYGSKDFLVEESWNLTALKDAINWRIQRQTKGVCMLEDAASAEWVFSDMQMWTGAILDNGGVAWNRLLEDRNMSYGSHAGKVLFWNKSDDRCLEIHPIETGDQQIATRFSHNPDDTHSFVHTLSDSALETRVNLSRFLLIVRNCGSRLVSTTMQKR